MDLARQICESRKKALSISVAQLTIQHRHAEKQFTIDQNDHRKMSLQAQARKLEIPRDKDIQLKRIEARIGRCHKEKIESGKALAKCERIVKVAPKKTAK